MLPEIFALFKWTHPQLITHGYTVMHEQIFTALQKDMQSNFEADCKMYESHAPWFSGEQRVILTNVLHKSYLNVHAVQ